MPCLRDGPMSSLPDFATSIISISSTSSAFSTPSTPPLLRHSNVHSTTSSLRDHHHVLNQLPPLIVHSILPRHCHMPDARQLICQRCRRARNRSEAVQPQREWSRCVWYVLSVSLVRELVLMNGWTLRRLLAQLPHVHDRLAPRAVDEGPH